MVNEYLTRENIKRATMARLKGIAFANIATTIFGVSIEQERSWRKQGFSDSKHNKDSSYRTYYNKVGKLVNRISDKNLKLNRDEVFRLLKEEKLSKFEISDRLGLDLATITCLIKMKTD